MPQTAQILRTTTNNPPAPLLPGAMSVELGAQTKLWIGAQAGNRLLLSSDPADAGLATAAYLKLSGGTLTGPLSLPANATTPLQAIPKQQLDAQIALKLNLTGGTLSGPLNLAADASQPLQAVTYQQLEAANANTANYLPLSGGTLSGPLHLPADANQPLEATTLQQLNAGTLHAGAGNVGRNILHNSMFNILQRGTGPFGNNMVGPDRWRLWTSPSDVVSAVVNGTDDAAKLSIGDEACVQVYYVTFTGGTDAPALVLLQQNVEGVRRLSGKTVTVSCWLAGATKVGISINQNFGTGGSPSPPTSGYGQAVTPNLGLSRYSVTIDIPTSTGKTLGTNGDDIIQVNFWLSTGANWNGGSGGIGPQSGNIVIWGVQLEVGSVATPLEKPDPRYDLANCQRFYQTGSTTNYGYGGAGGSIASSQSLVVTMRALPTVNWGALLSTNVTGYSVAAQGWETVATQATVVGNGGYGLNMSFTASADL